MKETAELILIINSRNRCTWGVFGLVQPKHSVLVKPMCQQDGPKEGLIELQLSQPKHQSQISVLVSVFLYGMSRLISKGRGSPHQISVFAGYRWNEHPRLLLD